jgi:hypothetical protein
MLFYSSLLTMITPTAFGTVYPRKFKAIFQKALKRTVYKDPKGTYLIKKARGVKISWHGLFKQ